MVILYSIYSLIASFFILLLSLIYVITCWWFLLLPRYKRYRTFDAIVIQPWTLIVNRFILAINMKVINRQHIDKKRATLYICNHQSWVDVPVLLRYTHTIALSKKQVRRLPLVNVLIIYGGTIFLDRDDASSRISIIKKLMSFFKTKGSISLFPEGTRSPDGKLLQPLNAVVRLCYKLNIPVVSSALEGTRDVLPRKGKYLKPFQKVVLKFNPPLYPKDYKSDEEYADACWDRVEKTHREILKDEFPEKYDKIYN